MKLPQFLHAFLKIFFLFCIADPRTVEIFCDFIAVLRINIGNLIADLPSGDRLIDGCFLAAVDQLICSLSRDTHNVFFIFAGE